MKTVGSLIVGLVLFASAAATAQDKKGGDKFDPAKMVGKWEYVSGVKNGEKVAEAALKDQAITITKDKITLKGKEVFVFKYEIDAATKPASIKLEILESPFGPGAKSAGIIAVKGDELKLCYAAMGETAPKAFESKEGSMAHLFVLKRVK